MVDITNCVHRLYKGNIFTDFMKIVKIALFVIS